jgi:hypothetical protein
MRNAKLFDWYLSSQGGVTYSEELQAVIDQALADGAITEQQVSDNRTLLMAMDDFIADEKADGRWVLTDILYLIGLNDVTLENFSRYNLIDPTRSRLQYFNLTYDENGITGNGTNGYATTNRNLSLSTIYLQDSAHRFAFMWLGGANAIDGVVGGTTNQMLPSASSGQRINGSLTSGTPDLSGDNQYVALNRPNSTQIESYKGTTRSVNPGTSAARTNDTQVLLRRGTTYGTGTMSAYGAGGSLTQTQHANRRTALINFRAAIMLGGVGVLAIGSTFMIS